MKKIFFFFLIFIAFFTSYFLKNFQILLLSLSLLTVSGLFFKKINKNITITLFSILISLTIIEIFLKYTSGQKILNLENSKNFNKNIRYQKSYLGFQPLPGKQNHLIVADGKKLINSTYTIDIDGFRNTPIIQNNSKDLEINFFGGSFVFGWGLDDNETLPYLVQNHFNNWNIKNYGISGYGVHQMLAQINNNVKTIGDINFLITHNAHVPRSACKKDYSFGTPRYILNDNSEVKRSGFCNNFFISTTQLPKIFGSIINRSELKKMFDKYFYKKSEFSPTDIKLYTSIIKKINEKILRENKYFFVGYIKNDLKTIDKKIIDYLKKNEIKLIDLTLENNDNYELYDGHPNKEANIMRSQIISTFLEDMKF